jgi:hypothetical protein
MAVLRREPLLNLGTGQVTLTLAGRKVAKLPESLHNRLAAYGTELTPLWEYGTRFLSLGGRKASEDLFALAKQLPLLCGQGVPAPQPLADKPLARRRQLPEPRILRHKAFLLGGRQVAQSLEESSSLAGQWPATLAPAGSLHRVPTRSSHLPLPSKQG